MDHAWNRFGSLTCELKILRCWVGLGFGFRVGTWSLRLSLELPSGLVLKWKMPHLWAWQRREGNGWKLPAWWRLNLKVLKEKGRGDWGCFLVVGVPDGSGSRCPFSCLTHQSAWREAPLGLLERFHGQLEKWPLTEKIFNWQSLLVAPGQYDFYNSGWGRKEKSTVFI